MHDNSRTLSRRPVPERLTIDGWWSSWLVGAGALATYLVLAPAVAGDKDAAEFTLVLATSGVCHPTGYPLYTLLGHAFVTIAHALGANWAYAANAWSAVGGALAVTFVYRLARALAGPARGAGLLALIPALLFGLNPLWTFETTLAETGAWHVAWAAGALLLCRHLLRALADATSVEPRLGRGALVWGFVCGLGLAHHATALLLAVPLTAVLAWRVQPRSALKRLLVPASAGAFLPLLSYGFIAWHAFHPARVQWPLLAPGWKDVLDHVTAAQYRVYFGAFHPSSGQAALLARYAYPYLGLSAVAFAVVIPFARARADRDTLVAMVAGLAVQCAVIFSYGVPDPSSYFLPVLGVGLVATAPALARLRQGALGQRRPALVGAVLLGVAIVAITAPWLRTGWERRQAYLKYDRMLRGMWQSITIDRGWVLWADDMVYRLNGWQILDGEKPGLEVLNPATLTHTWPRREFARRHGFDPSAGLRLPAGGAPGQVLSGAAAADLAGQLTRNLNEMSDLPVIEFDPAVPSVRLLRKAPPRPLDAEPPQPENGQSSSAPPN